MILTILRFLEGTGCSITSDGDILAHDLALLPFAVWRNDLGNGDVGGTFIFMSYATTVIERLFLIREVDLHITYYI